MSGFGIEVIYQDAPNQPLLLGTDWLAFENEDCARLVVALLSGLTRRNFKIVDLQEVNEHPIKTIVDSFIRRIKEG